MADGLFYVDSRMPFLVADQTAVTLLTTDLALMPTGSLPVMGTNYFGFPGKAVHIRMFGRITSAATPGNGTMTFYWGTNGAANGVSICATQAFALTASQTNLSWVADVIIRCRTIGSAGTLFGTGRLLFNNAIVTSDQMIPASAAAASAAVDLTSSTLMISPQFKRSGSTAETMQVHEYMMLALN